MASLSVKQLKSNEYSESDDKLSLALEYYLKGLYSEAITIYKDVLESIETAEESVYPITMLEACYSGLGSEGFGTYIKTKTQTKF